MSLLAVSGLAFAAAVACGGSPTGPAPPPSFSVHTSAHFVFRHTPLDAATIAATAESVEQHYTRVTADLGVGARPPIAVTLYADRASLRAAVVPLVGPMPDFASGLVTSPNDVHILSPSLVSAWSYQTGLTNIVHEVAHCVSLTVNASFANRPRWLWESVALYEARQRVDPTAIPALQSGRVLTFAELNALDNPLIYDVGYLLAEFIVAEWGREGLLALIRSNGDTTATLGLGEPEFMARFARRG